MDNKYMEAWYEALNFCDFFMNTEPRIRLLSPQDIALADISWLSDTAEVIYELSHEKKLAVNYFLKDGQKVRVDFAYLDDKWEPFMMSGSEYIKIEE